MTRGILTAMILTLTPNPLLNFVLEVGPDHLGVGNRVQTVPWTVGGKGVNVARMLKTLGRPGLVLTFAGGPYGEKIRQGLTQQGLAHRLVAVAAETRTGINLVGVPVGGQTWFLEEGADLAESEVVAMLELVRHEAHRGDILVVSGTVPGHTHRDFYRRVLEEAVRLGLEVFLDGTDEVLRQVAGCGRFVLKHNRDETRATFGVDPFVPEQAQAWVHAVRALGATAAMVTDAERHALLWDGEWVTVFRPPVTRLVSGIGCGDATMAGFVWALTTGNDLSTAARWGLATGSADAGHGGPCEATYPEVAARVAEVGVVSSALVR